MEKISSKVHPVLTDFHVLFSVWKIEKWTSILGQIFRDRDPLFDCYSQTNEHWMGILLVHGILLEGQRKTY